jgi:hypothetical protein
MVQLSGGDISAAATYRSSAPLSILRPAPIRRGGPFRQEADFGQVTAEIESSWSSQRAGRPVKVLYIIGFARSGTTILGNLLGEIDGFFHAGELCYFWERCFPPRSTARCGCWAILPECALWSAVLSTVEASSESSLLERDSESPGVMPDGGYKSGLAAMIGLQKHAHRCVSYWHAAKGVVARQGSSTAVSAFCRVQSALYGAIKLHTGAGVIVDSSKLPAPAVLLDSMPGVETYFAHMVRDPRAVLFSRQRRRIEQKGGHGHFNPQLLALDAFRCARDNLYAEAIMRGVDTRRVLRVSYERFVTNPRETIERIGDFVGEPMRALPLVEPHVACLRTNHTVRANRNRFVTGMVPILEDQAWRTALNSFDRFLGTALSAPLLLRYGYPFRVRRPT